MHYIRVVISLFLLAVSLVVTASQSYTAVSYNCENLFDTKHDSLKNDAEFTPNGARQWSFSRYWKKVNDIGRVIVQIGGKGEEWSLPDIVGLVEVENDSVMHMLTRKSLLKGASYNYVITESDDIRGLDVALMYNALKFKLLDKENIRISKIRDYRSTRDILHVTLRSVRMDTLHVFVVHSPSRRGGQYNAEEQRKMVIENILNRIKLLNTGNNCKNNIIVMGDFNDYSYSKPLRDIANAGLKEVTEGVRGLYHTDDVAGTYYFKQEWGSLDHIFTSENVYAEKCYIYDADWLLEKTNSGALKPRRTYLGEYYKGGVSDHLPLVLKFSIGN